MVILERNLTSNILDAAFAPIPLSGRSGCRIAPERTADPSATLRSARDDKERGVVNGGVTRREGWRMVRMTRKEGWLNGADDKERGVANGADGKERGVGEWCG